MGPPSLAQRYEIGKIIGEGNFAVVKECTERLVKIFLNMFSLFE